MNAVATPQVHVSSFASPARLWPLLVRGYSLVFRESASGDGETAHMTLGALDLNWGSASLLNSWHSYPRSIQGLHLALGDNAERLIEWRYSGWLDRSSNRADNLLRAAYSSLVHTYVRAMRHTLTDYFGINRAIEAGACYAQFLTAETTLLTSYQYAGHLYDWQSAVARRATFSAPPAEPPSLDTTIDPILVANNDYSIARRTRCYGLRTTIVTIHDMSAITPRMLVAWLREGYQVWHKQTTVFPPEKDGSVYVSDPYGEDCYAGTLEEPDIIVHSLTLEDVA